jgi:ADP-ribose pyrophosphatase
MRAKVKKSSGMLVMKEGRFLRLSRRGEWEYVSRNNCRGIVIIVAMTRDQRVILVEQYRPPVGKRVIEFPAGLISDDRTLKGESFFMAARRELLEETGYKANRMGLLLKGPVSSGLSSDMVTMVRGCGLTKVAPGGGDKLESIIVHEVALKRVDQWLKAMEKKGVLVEPKVYAGLYFLQKHAKMYS